MQRLTLYGPHPSLGEDLSWGVRMLRSILLMLCLALTAACAHTIPTGAPPLLRERAESGIEARLLSSTSTDIVSFHISEQAYVAVFAFHRNSATLLYPQHRGQLAPLQSGVHRAFTNRPFLRSGRAFRHAASHFGAGARAVTYLLIASTHPLDVASLIHRPERLRRDLQFTTVGYSEQATIAYLTDVAVPPGTPDEAWTTDVSYGWSTPSFSHSHSYAAFQAQLLDAPIGCKLTGSVTSYWFWSGPQCLPTPPRVPAPPPEKPPNDTTPEEPEKPEDEIRFGGVDAGSRVNRPTADPTVETRRGARAGQPQPARDVRAEPSRSATPTVDRIGERTPTADGTRERTATADRSTEARRERSSAPTGTRREASGESGQRSPRQNAPQQDVSRQSPAPAAQRAPARKQSPPPPPPRPAETRAATPDPRS